MMKVKGPGGPGENELLDDPQAGQQKKTMNNNKNNKNNNNNKPHFPYITHTPHDTHTTHGAHTQSCGCTRPTATPDTHEDYRDEKAAGEKRAQEKNKPNDTTPEKGEPKAREEERDRNNPGVDPEYPDTTRHPPDGITADHDLRAMQTGHTKIVKDFWDIPPFHASFLQRLSDRHRWVLYRLSFSQSPQQQFDEACSRAWTKEHGLHATACLDKAVYGLLQEALQDFEPARPIFWRHRIDHPLCASRVWFSLRDKFKWQLDIEGEQPITTARRHQIRELTKTNNKGFQPPTSIPTIQQTSTGAAPHVHTNNTHTRPKVPHTRHTAHKKTRPHHQDIPHGGNKALYTRHTAHKNARPRVSYIKHTTYKDPHNSRPHHHEYKTARGRPHEGVNRSQPRFKKQVKQFSDRPSDRVDSTHTHTHPTPKRLLPSHGMK